MLKVNFFLPCSATWETKFQDMPNLKLFIWKSHLGGHNKHNKTVKSHSVSICAEQKEGEWMKLQIGPEIHLIAGLKASFHQKWKQNVQPSQTQNLWWYYWNSKPPLDHSNMFLCSVLATIASMGNRATSSIMLGGSAEDFKLPGTYKNQDMTEISVQVRQVALDKCVRRESA